MNEKLKERLDEVIQLKKDGRISGKDMKELLTITKTIPDISSEAGEKRIMNVSNNDWKFTSENVAASTALLSSDEGFKSLIRSSNYMDLPVGSYYVDAKGVAASLPQTRAAVIKALEYMVSTVEDKSLFFIGEGYMNLAIYFYNYILPVEETPLLEEYLYLLYRLNEVASNSIFNPLLRLEEMWHIVKSEDFFTSQFNFDTFCICAKFMLGFIMNEERIESYLKDLTTYYEMGHREAVSWFINDIMNNFLHFVNSLVANNEQFYLVDESHPDLKFPCGIYVERGIWEGINMIQIYLSFELNGKKFYMGCYHRYLVVNGNSLTLEDPILQITIK